MLLRAEQSKLERSGIDSSNLRFLLLDHHLPGSGWAELCQCSVQFTDCAVGPGGLKLRSDKQWWRGEETRPETQTRAQCLMVVYFLRWSQPQSSLGPAPALPRFQAPLICPGRARWLPQKLNKFSPIDQIPTIQPLTAQTRAPCVPRSHWSIWSQVSGLGQWQPASHCNTILSIRTAEKEHVGPQLSQVYKTMLHKFQ